MNFDIPHIINYFHMKKNVLSNILFFFFLFLVSCAGEKQVVNNVYPILDLDQAIPVDSIKFSDIFDSAKIITFDKSSQALIGDVNRVEIVDDYIFVLDRNIAKTVFTFDDQGRFLRKIGAVGQGKGEYTSPFDFTLDKEKKHIFILDRQQKKVHKYDYSTGKHLSSINIPKFSTNILYHKDVLYMDYPESHSNKTDFIIRRSDVINGKELDLLFSPDIHNKGWKSTLANSDGIFFSRTTDFPVLTHLFMDTVYSIGQNGVSPYLVIHSESMMEKEDIANLNLDRDPMGLIQLMKKNKYYNLQTYIENNDFIFFQLQKGAMPCPFYYDKKQNETLQGKLFIEDILFNNLDFKLIQLRFGGSNSKGVFFYLTSERLSEFNKLKGIKENSGFKDAFEFGNREDIFNGAIFYYEYKN